MGKLFGLLGYHIGHSMSPMMHNDSFQHLKLGHYYHLFDVAPEQLENAVIGIRALQIAGFNVTIPHKVAIMSYLDEIDETAKMIGAVNTVVNQNGKLIGYNTDCDGYLESLLTVTNNDLHDMNVVIIGAGGAARAVAFSLACFGVKSLILANRTIEKAKMIATDFNYLMDIEVRSIKEIEQQLSDFDLIVNTTSIGMSPNVEAIPLSLQNMKSSAIVSDIIYNPLSTKLLTEAKARGATTINGVGMFVGQGALAFKKWTGIEPDRKRMEAIVLKQLGG